LQPKLVTFEELRVKLLPYCLGWAWAEDAIRDLWLKGAPVPTAPHTPETRVLLPGQFRAWWGEIQQRMGLPVGASDLYNQLTGSYRTQSGFTGGKRD
jgi:hypothetical protein